MGADLNQSKNQLSDANIKATGRQPAGGDNFVIVIGRQFGSGGRTIGKLLAERLGVAYYDTELLRMAAQREGVRADVFKDLDEKKPSVLKALVQGAYGIADNFHSIPLSGVNAYNIQCKVIKDICNKESCVIVGRNADYIMRNHPRLLSIFLHAPIDYRINKILERREALSREEALDLAQKHDRRRESYYNFYRGEKKWGMADNYHLCIDTSRFDTEALVNLILNIAPEKINLKEPT